MTSAQFAAFAFLAVLASGPLTFLVALPAYLYSKGLI